MVLHHHDRREPRAVIYPWRSIRAQFGLVIGAYAVINALLISTVVGVGIQSQIETNISQMLSMLATHMSSTLDRSMFERYRDIQILTTLSLLRNPDTSVTIQRQLLEELQLTYPDYAWIGLIDTSGRVRVATGGMLEGADASQRDLFIYGRQGPFISDVHNAKLLVKLLPQTSNTPPRFVDIAMPVSDLTGQPFGVVVAHLSWSWAHKIDEQILGPIQANNQVEAFIVSHTGQVLLGPRTLATLPERLDIDSIAAAQRGETVTRVEQWPDGQFYLTSAVQSRGYRTYPGLGWTVVVRKPVDLAFAPAQQIQDLILVGGLLAGTLFATIGWLLTDRITRPLQQITRVSERLRTGKAASIPQLHSGDEVAQLAASFDTLVHTLREQEQALQASNTQLRQSEARLRGILTSAMDAIIAIDAEQQIVLFNPAAEQIFGYRADEVIGKPLDILLPQRFHAYHQHKVYAFGQTETVTRAMHTRGEVFARHHDGHEFPIEASIAHTMVNGQKLYTVILRDISARIQLEQQFFQAQKMESIGRLAGGVAHDFNNLLTAIGGYIELGMLSLEADEPAQDDLTEAQRAVERAAKLTRQLLTFARQQPMTTEPTDLNSLIREIEKLLLRLMHASIDLQINLASQPIYVAVDSNQIGQVVMNLAVNARDAMPDGGLLRISVESLTLTAQDTLPAGVKPGQYACLSVEDTGIGISAEIQNHIFEPFFTTKAPGKGTGLGLATCYGIVAQHAGVITCESIVGQGATFRIYLPLITSTVPSEPRSPSSEVLSGGRETILLVEDEDAVRSLSGRVLRDLGYTVLEAANGAEALWALDRLGSMSLDLLITDVVMPRYNGTAIIAQLRSSQPHARVLVISGYGNELINELGQFSNVALLAKPFTPTILARTVRTLLDQYHERSI